jgi:hypothetical protein
MQFILLKKEGMINNVGVSNIVLKEWGGTKANTVLPTAHF